MRAAPSRTGDQEPAQNRCELLVTRLLGLGLPASRVAADRQPTLMI